MKFKDLEEGKEYKAHNIRWKFVNDTLFRYLQDDWRVCQWKYNELLTVDFEEVVAYVSFQEAVEHMKKGCKAKFYYENDDIISSDYIMEQDKYGYYILRKENHSVVAFCDEHLKPKWILL